MPKHAKSWSESKAVNFVGQVRTPGAVEVAVYVSYSISIFVYMKVRSMYLLIASLKMMERLEGDFKQLLWAALLQYEGQRFDAMVIYYGHLDPIHSSSFPCSFFPRRGCHLLLCYL